MSHRQWTVGEDYRIIAHALVCWRRNQIPDWSQLAFSLSLTAQACADRYHILKPSIHPYIHDQTLVPPISYTVGKEWITMSQNSLRPETSIYESLINSLEPVTVGFYFAPYPIPHTLTRDQFTLIEYKFPYTCFFPPEVIELFGIPRPFVAPMTRYENVDILQMFETEWGPHWRSLGDLIFRLRQYVLYFTSNERRHVDPIQITHLNYSSVQSEFPGEQFTCQAQFVENANFHIISEYPVNFPPHTGGPDAQI